jgi:ribosomal protein S18 acetylase RimI-like enzyme
MKIENIGNNNENLIIRKAEIADIDLLFEFEQEIVAAERLFDSTLKEGEIHYYDLEELVLAPDTEVVVAVLGDEIIGSGYSRIKEAKDYLKHNQYAFLGFMYVKPEHRGKGVNQQILAALEKWTIDQGITEMRLEVYKDNLAAVRAYEKSGFTANLLEMRKEAKPRNSD